MSKFPMGISDDGNKTDHRLQVVPVDGDAGILKVVVVGNEDEGEEIVSARLIGSTVEESKTQADADSNVITFSANIDGVEIYHAEDTGQEFVVNGITLAVPAGGWRALIGGTPGKTVTIPANVDCTVARMS